MKENDARVSMEVARVTEGGGVRIGEAEVAGANEFAAGKSQSPPARTPVVGVRWRGGHPGAATGEVLRSAPQVGARAKRARRLPQEIAFHVGCGGSLVRRAPRAGTGLLA